MVYYEQVKKNKFISRLVAVLGIAPGIWFLIVTQTEFGQRITLQCGYWFVMLIMMSFVWFFYAVFVKNILRGAKATQDHAHDLNEKRHAQIAYTSTIIEALAAAVIFVLSTIGFLLTDILCVMSKYVPGIGM